LIMGGKLSKKKKGYDVSDPKEKKEESAVVATASEQKAKAPQTNQDGSVEIKAEQVAESATAPPKTPSEAPTKQNHLTKRGTSERKACGSYDCHVTTPVETCSALEEPIAASLKCLPHSEEPVAAPEEPAPASENSATNQIVDAPVQEPPVVPKEAVFSPVEAAAPSDNPEKLPAPVEAVPTPVESVAVSEELASFPVENIVAMVEPTAAPEEPSAVQEGNVSAKGTEAASNKPAAALEEPSVPVEATCVPQESVPEESDLNEQSVATEEPLATQEAASAPVEAVVVSEEPLDSPVETVPISKEPLPAPVESTVVSEVAVSDPEEPEPVATSEQVEMKPDESVITPEEPEDSQVEFTAEHVVQEAVQEVLNAMEVQAEGTEPSGISEQEAKLEYETLAPSVPEPEANLESLVDAEEPIPEIVISESASANEIVPAEPCRVMEEKLENGECESAGSIEEPSPGLAKENGVCQEQVIGDAHVDGPVDALVAELQGKECVNGVVAEEELICELKKDLNMAGDVGDVEECLSAAVSQAVDTA
ncbi:hypothetical protein QTP86_028492, partial [Hemibagrus guttatus]